MHSGGDEKHGDVVDAVLLILGRQPTPVFKTIEAPLDDIARSVAVAIDRDGDLLAEGSQE